jgi:4-amino-4-deoxy-L-arabinose transferase-like glycosyltransferase
VRYIFFVVDVPNHRKSTILLAALIIAHMVLAVWFAAITPYRTKGYELAINPETLQQIEMGDIGAPDELQHSNYVRNLMRTGQFPVLNPKDPDLYQNYQSHQPPLYYVLAAAWSKLTIANPDLGSQQDGFKLRFLNIIFGALTVLGTYRLARAVKASESTALLAAMIPALLPMNLALSGAMSNDPLLFALIAWCLVMIAKGVTDGWDTKTAITAGVLAGLAALTKTTAISLFAALFFAAAAGYVFKREGKRAGPWIAIEVGLAIAAPWWIRNLGVYGDPFAMNAFTASFGGTTQAADMQDSVGVPQYWVKLVGLFVARSFIGTFGYMNIWLSSTGGLEGKMQVYDVALLILFVGAVAGLFKVRTNSAASIVLGLYTLTIFVLFVRFNMQYFQAQARYLYPALAPISVLIAAGWSSIDRNKKGFAVLALSIALLLPMGMAFKNVPAGFEQRLQPMSKP